MNAQTRRDFDSTDADPHDRCCESAIATTVLALRAKEAARALGIGERQLWSLTRSGQIPHVRVGRSVTYPIDLLRDWLKRRAKGGK